MRLRFIIFLLPLSFIFTQVDGSEQFLQEICTVFTPDDGLPEMPFLEIRINESGSIIAVSGDGEFIYDGEKWKIFPNSSLKKDKEEIDAYVLSRATYQHRNYLGKEGR